jgi:hypothetical protein
VHTQLGGCPSFGIGMGYGQYRLVVEIDNGPCDNNHHWFMHLPTQLNGRQLHYWGSMKGLARLLVMQRGAVREGEGRSSEGCAAFRRVLPKGEVT